jgi:hypothetical protein
MNRENRVVLTISCWAGVSFNAEHYYGKLSGYNNGEYVTYDLEYVMSIKQAKKLSKKDDWEYEEGRKSSRFDTKDEIREIALAEWKNYYPDSQALLEGQSASAEPLKCLWVKNSEYIDELNKLWETNEATPHISKNWKVIDDMCDRFDKLLEKATT